MDASAVKSLGGRTCLSFFRVRVARPFAGGLSSVAVYWALHKVLSNDVLTRLLVVLHLAVFLVISLFFTTVSNPKKLENRPKVRDEFV
jgi:hypothetical protein